MHTKSGTVTTVRRVRARALLHVSMAYLASLMVLKYAGDW